MKKPRRYEGSPADEKKDRAGAKKAGMSMKDWEKSAADKRADAAGQRALDRKKKRKAR